jgi:PKD repeat protein
LTVTGAGGSDTLTRTNYIDVTEPAPVADFSGSPTSGISPLTVGFTDASTGAVSSYAWSFGDGGTSTLQNPSHLYSAAGTYSVSLTVTGPGGSDTLTRTNYIDVTEPAPVAGFSGSPTSGTSPLTVGFADASTGAVSSYAWSFGDGGTSTLQNPSHVYSAVGTYSVSLTVTGPGGSDTLTRTNYIDVAEPAPVAGFSGSPTSGTSPLTVSFADGSTGAVSSYAWSFGDGGTSTLQNPSHVYSAVGTYSVSLTVTGAGGSDTLTRTNYIDVTDPAPVAGFSGTPTSGTSPLTVGFTDASTGAVSSYAWSFGDGGTSTLQNPSHLYSAAGTYSVSLTVTGPGGSDVLTRTNYIDVTEPAPVAEFSGTPTSGAVPLVVAFADGSTGAVSSYAWDFGDGGTSTLQSPGHTYSAVGVYTVSLTVTGPGGSDTRTRLDYISVGAAVPVADFDGVPTSGTAPLNVTFSDTSIGTITTWSWNFGDGGTSSLQDPSHVYSAAGSYTVSLTVTGPGGADTATKLDYVVVTEPAPVADFSGTPTSGTAPLSVAFSDASTGAVSSWAWDFGDGATSTLQSPSHIYTVVGTYSVSLTVTGPGGSDTMARLSYIDVTEPAPVADFSGTPTSGTSPLTVVFSDASTGALSSWAWDFGDGSTSALQNPSHVYLAVGTYSVSLTVTGPGGSDTLTRTNYINVTEPAPVASFSGTPTSGTSPLDVAFTDSSGGAISGWAWDFGDGGSSTLQNPSHTFVGAGVYTVSLTVTGPGGSDTAIEVDYITVTDPPGGGPLHYMTFVSNTAVPGVGTVRDEDVVTYDPSTDTWAMYFDGSDMGIGAVDVDAIHVRGNGEIIMSFQAALNTVPNLVGGPNGVSVTDKDLVVFTPTSTGSNTAGSFTFLFDGSDMGLGTSKEDVDGVHEFADGSLALSFRGSTNVSLGSFRDEDILLFTPTTLGTNTTGTWSWLFDGSDVGMSNNGGEDLSAVSFDAAGDLWFSTVGDFVSGSAAGTDEDLVRFSGTFGPATSGAVTVELRLASFGIASGEDVDGLSVH